jgi:hypothetical protein
MVVQRVISLLGGNILSCLEGFRDRIGSGEPGGYWSLSETIRESKSISCAKNMRPGRKTEGIPTLDSDLVH